LLHVDRRAVIYFMTKESAVGEILQIVIGLGTPDTGDQGNSAERHAVMIAIAYCRVDPADRDHGDAVLETPDNP
jgi:hypothetical protein